MPDHARPARRVGLSTLALLTVVLSACSSGSHRSAAEGGGSGPAATAASTTGSVTGSGPGSAPGSGPGSATPTAQPPATPTAQPTGSGPTLGEPAGEGFSTVPATSQSSVSGELLSVQAEADGAVERLTFTFDAVVALPGYRVELVPVVTAGPDGEPVEIDGSAFLSIALTSTTAGPAGPLPAEVPTNEDLDLPLLQQIVLVYNVAGDLRFGLGLSGPATFQVRTGSDPARLVVELTAS